MKSSTKDRVIDILLIAMMNGVRTCIMYPLSISPSRNTPDSVGILQPQRI